MANGTIAFDTLQTSGQITGTAKSVDTDYLASGSAKMVINYDHRQASIMSSLNVASVSDDATGKFTITFTASKTDINYSPSSASIANAGSDRVGNFVGIAVTDNGTVNARSTAFTTSTLKINSGYASNASANATAADSDANCVQTFGELA
jgi:hypothetical protein